MVYFSIFTGFIFTFSVNLAHTDARNNTEPLCKKHILPNPDYLLWTKIIPITFLYSLLFMACVEGTLSVILGCMDPCVDMGKTHGCSNHELAFSCKCHFYTFVTTLANNYILARNTIVTNLTPSETSPVPIPGIAFILTLLQFQCSRTSLFVEHKLGLSQDVRWVCCVSDFNV